MSIDGSWHKRGRTSKNGIVTVIDTIQQIHWHVDSQHVALTTSSDSVTWCFALKHKSEPGDFGPRLSDDVIVNVGAGFDTLM